MLHHSSSLLLLLAALGVCGAASLPKYIKVCKKSDPDFDKCALHSGREAIRRLVAGEKSLRLLPLSPLRLPFIQLENRGDFQLNLTDVELLGLEKAELVDFKADFDKREVKLVVHLEEIFLKGIFHMDGRILILPLKGDGPGSLKAYGGNYTVTLYYDLIKKNDQEYAKIMSNKFDFSIQKAVFDVEHLFGSDTGKEITTFLNENWYEVIKDFQNVIGTTIGKIAVDIGGKVIERVPYNTLFLD